jgi:hypothetical protein
MTNDCPVRTTMFSKSITDLWDGWALPYVVLKISC